MKVNCVPSSTFCTSQNCSINKALLIKLWLSSFYLVAGQLILANLLQDRRKIWLNFHTPVYLYAMCSKCRLAFSSHRIPERAKCGGGLPSSLPSKAGLTKPGSAVSKDTTAATELPATRDDTPFDTSGSFRVLVSSLERESLFNLEWGLFFLSSWALYFLKPGHLRRKAKEELSGELSHSLWTMVGDMEVCGGASQTLSATLLSHGGGERGNRYFPCTIWTP